MTLVALLFQVTVTVATLPLALLYNLFCYYFKGDKQHIESSKDKVVLLEQQKKKKKFPKEIEIKKQMMTLKKKSIRLHVVKAGPENGKLVVLLHGYPDLWYCWKHQIIRLARSGYHVVVPDMRGYNLSDKPKGLNQYKISELCSDISLLIDEMGKSKAHIMGHDWGGVVAQFVAMYHPEKVEKLVVLNAPHPSLHFKSMTQNPRQFLMSWYIILHLFPLIPELLFLNALRMYKAILPRISESYRELLIASSAQEYATTARANYYRAIVWYPPKISEISNDTLIIWGKRDKFLLPETADPDLLQKRNLIRNISKKTVDASHFLLHQKPDEINEYLLEFLK